MKDKKRISNTAMQKLQDYSWPGNVRELENIICSLYIMSRSNTITEDQLPEWIVSASTSHIEDDNTNSSNFIKWLDKIPQVKYKDFIREAEKAYIERSLEEYKGDKSKTAEALDVSLSTLYSRLKLLKIEPN